MTIGYLRSPDENGPLLRAMDIPPLATVLFFAAVSFLYPDTGSLLFAGFSIPTGYAVGTAYLAVLVLVVLVIRAERRHGGKVLSFVRTFYPQALITPFFFESIRLSAFVFGGVSHDAVFAALDRWIFGFEPYLVFHKPFESFPRFNELMFGSYFSFYVIVVTVLWVPWIKGDRDETERSVFIYFLINMAVTIWYVFFRVQGPKYWIPELRSHWYGGFEGFFFVPFFQRGFDSVSLAGAAFPSSHILFTTLSIIFAYRWEKRLLAFYFPMLALILLATVYLFAHYAVDGLASLVLAPPLYLAASRLYEPVRRLLSPGEKAPRGAAAAGK